jgi:hypothetical protein
MLSAADMFGLGDNRLSAQKVIMGRNKGRSAKKRERGKKATAASAGVDTVREELLQDAGGFDWGWPSFDMVVGSHELTQRLVAGGFSGCGYGVIPDGPPFISLMGDNLPGMKSALALIKEWTTLSGPNAIRIEIAYDGPGYVLAISQQLDLLRWRLSGIDTVGHPLIVTMSHMKRMDSRHPNLDHLADYAQEPVAPLWLIVNEMPKGALGKGSRTYEFVPQWDNAVLLPGIDIYRTPDERPADSMAKLVDEVIETSREWPPSSDKDSAVVATTRERRLSASLPKTLHVLRNTDLAKHLFDHGGALGAARWQVEQAICNLQSAKFLAYQPSSKAKRLSMIADIRNQLLEPASTMVDLAEMPIDELSKQLALDAGYLLRRLEPERPLADAVGDRIARIKELGYG